MLVVFGSWYPMPLGLVQNFHDVTVVDMGDLPESEVSIPELSDMTRKWPPAVIAHMRWRQPELEEMQQAAKLQYRKKQSEPELDVTPLVDPGTDCEDELPAPADRLAVDNTDMDSELQSVFVDVVSLPAMIIPVSDVDRVLDAPEYVDAVRCISRFSGHVPASYGHDLGGVESIVADSASSILNIR